MKENYGTGTDHEMSVPPGEQHINRRGKPRSKKTTDPCVLPSPGITTDIQTHTLRTHIHRGKNKKMGGPNDQGMSSTWFHFELKILEHLTMASRVWLASNWNPI